MKTFEYIVTKSGKQIILVRCKDCRHWMRNPINESSEWGLCFKHKDVALATDRTDWCSWAERKEE